MSDFKVKSLAALPLDAVRGRVRGMRNLPYQISGLAIELQMANFNSIAKCHLHHSDQFSSVIHGK